MNNPPEEQLLESGTLQIEQFDDADAASDISEDKQVASASNPPKREKKITRPPRSKKARLTDVIEKSNEQMGNIASLIASSIVTSEAREKERKEDREFFGQMFNMLSQTMIGISSQMHQNSPHQYFPHVQQPFQPHAFFGINQSGTFQHSPDTSSYAEQKKNDN